MLGKHISASLLFKTDRLKNIEISFLSLSRSRTSHVTIYREIMIIIARKEDLEKGKNRVERNTIGKTQYNNNAYTESGYRKSREAIKRQARALVRILSLSLYGFASSKRARKRGRNQ